VIDEEKRIQIRDLLLTPSEQWVIDSFRPSDLVYIPIGAVVPQRQYSQMTKQILLAGIHQVVDIYARFDLPSQIRNDTSYITNSLPRPEAMCVWCLEMDILASGRMLSEPSGAYKSPENRPWTFTTCSRCERSVETAYYY
jgi:hypothetical protein